MFEKNIQYIDLINKNIEICLKLKINNKNHNIFGLCINNPNIEECNFYYSVFNYIGIWVEKRPEFICTSYIINKNDQLSGENIYIPTSTIQSIYYIKLDNESKLMLFWINKYKKLPQDIINCILDYMRNWKIKIPVVGRNGCRLAL